MKSKILFLPLLAFLILWSCGKDDDPLPEKNNAPTINEQTFSVVENISDDQPIGIITASDKDGDELVFSIVTNSDDLFEIDQKIGTLSLKKGMALDFSAKPKHIISVKVSDGKASASASITINVSKVQSNNIAPNISDQSFEVPESITDTEVIGTVAASDDDGDVLNYTITTDVSGLFKIDASTGELKLLQGKILDFDTFQEHDIAISVADGKGGVNSANIKINVMDVEIEMSQDALQLYSNNTEQIQATISGTSGTLFWESDNTDVAIVDQEGNVTALTVGSANITASLNHIAVSLAVTVNTDVYITIWENNAGNEEAQLWNNGQTSKLNNGYANAYPNSVYVKQNDVYVAGRIFEGNNNWRSTLWLNGNHSFLSDGLVSATLNAVFIDETNVYVTGNSGNKATVWKNNDALELTDGLQYATGFSVSTDGINEYIAGQEGNSAMLWKNGIASNLGNGVARSVYVNDSDIYVAGYVSINNSPFATLWKNGVPVALGDPNLPGIAYSVYVDQNDVYVVGKQDGKAMLWKNGQAIELTNGSSLAVAYDIKMIKGNTYIVGYEANANFVRVAKLWINGSPTDLTDGLNDAIATSIFVK